MFGQFVLDRMKLVGFTSVVQFAAAVKKAASHANRVINGYPALPDDEWPAWEQALQLDGADLDRFRDLAAIQHLPRGVQPRFVAILARMEKLEALAARIEEQMAREANASKPTTKRRKDHR